MTFLQRNILQGETEGNHGADIETISISEREVFTGPENSISSVQYSVLTIILILVYLRV